MPKRILGNRAALKVRVHNETDKYSNDKANRTDKAQD